jgi:hypothetical protein
MLLFLGIAGIGVWVVSRLSSTAFQYWADRVLNS